MEEERIGLFLDFENLAIGARERGITFDFQPIADALAERGRVVVRRAYGDWSMFDDARRDLTRHHVELIEIPQRMGHVRKNAADIKLAVDAIELSLERQYVTTFVIGTGDSDFTPLVHKLREHNKRVIGLGIEASTSALLPAACDEFLFYERLSGVDQSPPKSRRPSRRKSDTPVAKKTDAAALDILVTQTLAGLKRRSNDAVLGSHLKRALRRKDPTFDESDYGFRSLGELLRSLEQRQVVRLTPGSAPADPEVDFPQGPGGHEEAFALLRDVVTSLGAPQLAGLKSEIRKRQPDFTEKRFGYGGFLQFCKAAEAAGYVAMERGPEGESYTVRAPASDAAPAEKPKPRRRKAAPRRAKKSE